MQLNFRIPSHGGEALCCFRYPLCTVKSWLPDGITSAVSHVAWPLNSIRKKSVTRDSLTSISPVKPRGSLFSGTCLL